MKIYLHELAEIETELDFTQEEAWVREAVEQADETQEDDVVSTIHELRSDDALKKLAKKEDSRPIQVHFSIRKVDEVVVLSGRIQTFVKLVCSRCANTFELTCRPGISGLFCKDPVMAGIAHLSENNRPVGQNKGSARHAHDPDADEAISQGKDLDITYLSNDYVNLREVLTEHLQLQVPFQPLCRENCKGMCSQCGADLIVGRCACAKIANTQPFSVLKDLKI